MGRSASHITLECALLTKPNWAYIGEEVEAEKLTLNQIVSQLADLIVERAAYQCLCWLQSRRRYVNMPLLRTVAILGNRWES